MNIEDLADCIVTFEDVCKSLEEIENKLAERLNIKNCNIREKLIQLDLDNELTEDKLVKNWHQTYASYLCDIKQMEYDKHVAKRIYECLCLYCYETMYLSFIPKDNNYYQEMLKFNYDAIVPLLNNIDADFGWVIFVLLWDITENCKFIMPEFPTDSAGKLDKVKEYWLTWGKEHRYIK